MAARHPIIRYWGRAITCVDGSHLAQELRLWSVQPPPQLNTERSPLLTPRAALQVECIRAARERLCVEAYAWYVCEPVPCRHWGVQFFRRGEIDQSTRLYKVEAALRKHVISARGPSTRHAL
jgi:hypothetical protein